MAILQQRPTKGARISTFYPVKTVPPLASLDSAFQLQEYISLLIRLDVHDVERIVSIPGRPAGKEREGSDDMRGEDREIDREGKGDVTVDSACWLYEQLRRLSQDLTHPLITTLQQECTRQTCPEMKAGEWLYLCVAHGNDGSMEQCCAIDYILHTLDSATALLNSPKVFPSRLSIPPSAQRHFSSLARRLGRIFAHAYYHHREAFEQAEAESSLYERFLALTSKFELVPPEFLVIPPRMQAIHDERTRDREVEANDVPEIQETREPPNESDGKQWNPIHGSSSVVDLSLDGGRGGSPPSPEGPRREPSPRKGRSRTDTMVYSEAVNIAEELSKGDGFSEADLDRAIAQERMMAADDQSFEEPLSDEAEGEESLRFRNRHATIRFADTGLQPMLLLKRAQGGEPGSPIAAVKPEASPQEDKQAPTDPVDVPPESVEQVSSPDKEYETSTEADASTEEKTSLESGTGTETTADSDALAHEQLEQSLEAVPDVPNLRDDVAEDVAASPEKDEVEVEEISAETVSEVAPSEPQQTSVETNETIGGTEVSEEPERPQEPLSASGETDSAQQQVDDASAEHDAES